MGFEQIIGQIARNLHVQQDSSTQFNYYRNTETGDIYRVAEEGNHPGTLSGLPPGAERLQGATPQDQLRQLEQVVPFDNAADAAHLAPQREGDGHLHLPSPNELHLFSNLSSSLNPQRAAQYLQSCPETPGTDAYDTWITQQLADPPNPQTFERRIQENQRRSLDANYRILLGEGQVEGQANRLAQAVQPDQLAARSQQARLLVQLRAQLNVGTGVGQMTPEQFQQIVEANQVADASHLPSPQCNPTTVQAALREGQLRQRLESIYSTMEDGSINFAEGTTGADRFMTNAPRDLTARQAWVTERLAQLNANPAADRNALALLVVRDTPSSTTTEASSSTTPANSNEVQLRTQIAQITPHFTSEDTNTLIRLLPHPYGDPTATSTTATAYSQQLAQSLLFLRQHPTRGSFDQAILPQARVALVRQVVAQENIGWSDNDPRIAAAAPRLFSRNNHSNLENLEGLLAASRSVTNTHRAGDEETGYQAILSHIRNITPPAEVESLHVATPTENRPVRTQMDGYIVRLQTPPLDLHTQRVISDIFRNSNLEEMQRLLPVGTSTGELQHRVQQYLENQTTLQVLRSVNGGENSFHPLNAADARAVARQILSERFGGALPQASDQAFDFSQYQVPERGRTSTSAQIDQEVSSLGIGPNVFNSPLYQRTQLAAQQNATTQIASFLQREYSDHYTDAALARRDAVLYLHHANTASGERRVFEHPGALQEIANTLESHGRRDTSVNQTPIITNIQSFYGSTLNHVNSTAYQALNTAVVQDPHYSSLMNVAQGVQSSSARPARARPAEVSREAVFVGTYQAGGANDVYALPDGSRVWLIGDRTHHFAGTMDQVRTRPDAASIPQDIYNRIGAGSDVNSLVQAGTLTVEEADIYTALHQEPAAAPSATPAPARGRHGRQATARAATPAVTPPEDRGPALLARMARGDRAARPEYNRYISEQTTLRFLQTHHAAGIEFGLAYRSGVARRALGTLPAPMPTQWPSDDAGLRALAQRLTPAEMPSQAQLELTRELLRDQEGARVAQQAAAANAPASQAGPRSVNVHTVTAPTNIQGNADVWIRFTDRGRPIHVPAAPATHTPPPPPPTAATSPWRIEGRTVTAGGDITAYYKSGNVLISVANNGRGAVTNPATAPNPAFAALTTPTARVTVGAASTASATATTTPETPQHRLTETSVRADAERHEAINNILDRYRSNRGSNVNTQGNIVPNPREQALRVLSQLHLIDEQGIPNPEVTAQQIREAVPHPENVTAPASDLQTFNTSLQSLRQSMGLTSSTTSTAPGAANPSATSTTSAGPGRFRFADLPPNATEAQIAAAEAEANQAMEAFMNRRTSGGSAVNAEGAPTAAGHQSLEQLTQSSTNPVSRGIMNSALAQTYVEGVHQYLTTHGFTPRNARAIEMHLGLVDNLEGHVPNSLNRDTAEAVFFRLNSATSDPQHLTPNDLVTNMISDYRQQNRDALVRMGFSSDEAARYLLARSELGENAMVNLANLAEDHARLTEAATSPSARTVFLNQARQAITNVNLPANGPISEQVTQLAETPAASATEGNNSTGNTAPRGGRQRGGAARGAAAAAGDSDIRGGNGRNRADANTLMNSQVTRERTAQEAENARRQSADTRRGQDLQLQGTRYQADRAYETEERRQEGEMIRSRLSNLNQLRIETLRVKAQMLQAMMQLLGQLISAAIGALAQVQAANISSVAQINAGLTQSRGRTA